MAVMLAENIRSAFTIKQLYEYQQTFKNEKVPKRSGKVNHKYDDYFQFVLEKQVQKLIHEGKFSKTELFRNKEKVIYEYRINKSFYEKAAVKGRAIGMPRL
mmetsp:Transcript_14025/g.23829  ORF Transcript_14025/g.23829 Transcript_14025/m.23829 type:complete len:101 (-) Transcript_14025:14-316(-)